MAGKSHAREFLVDPATVIKNNDIIAEKLTLVRLIRVSETMTYNSGMARSTPSHHQFKDLPNMR